MTDFHMHVLPEMDDGSKSVEMSLGMLERSSAYGVETVAATSHFYAWENSPRKFLARRAEAHERLLEASAGREDLPRVLLGSEVCFFDGVSGMDELEELCLEGTRLLLLEMPFVRWTERMLREVETIQRGGLIPVAAHIERYLDLQPKGLINEFFELGVPLQCNASFFLDRRARRALKMFRRGQIRFLGSDAHNLSSRPPNLGGAAEVLKRKLGREEWDRFEAEAEFLINGDL